jgi:hypothetical protein
MKFKSRPEARDWCKTHHPGSPITEIGSGRQTTGAQETMSARRDRCLRGAQERSERVRRRG